MNLHDPATPDAILASVLACDPRADLDSIRRAHPSLGRLSQDQLSLRVGRALERRADRFTK